jgi:hypothetical protein
MCAACKRKPKLDRRHHDLPQAQQARDRPLGDTLDDLKPPFGGNQIKRGQD